MGSEYDRQLSGSYEAKSEAAHEIKRVDRVYQTHVPIQHVYMTGIFTFLSRGVNGTCISNVKMSLINLLNIYAHGFKELCQRDGIFFEVHPLS